MSATRLFSVAQSGQMVVRAIRPETLPELLQADLSVQRLAETMAGKLANAFSGPGGHSKNP